MRDFHSNRGGSNRNFGGRDSERTMYKATCSDCGQTCEVPFKPMHGKSVYCNNCFRKKDGGGDRFGNDRGDRFGGGNERFGKRNFEKRGDFDRPNFRDRERQMFETTCAECGERCEVPFRPNGEKPIYCNDCFGSNKGGGDFSSPKKFEEKKTEGSKEQFEQLNAKLDKILKTLEIIQGKKTFIVEKETVAVKAEPKKEAETKKEPEAKGESEKPKKASAAKKKTVAKKK